MVASWQGAIGGWRVRSQGVSFDSFFGAVGVFDVGDGAVFLDDSDTCSSSCVSLALSSVISATRSSFSLVRVAIFASRFRSGLISPVCDLLEDFLSGSEPFLALLVAGALVELGPPVRGRSAVKLHTGLQPFTVDFLRGYWCPWDP